MRDFNLDFLFFYVFFWKWFSQFTQSVLGLVFCLVNESSLVIQKFDFFSFAVWTNVIKKASDDETKKHSMTSPDVQSGLVLLCYFFLFRRLTLFFVYICSHSKAEKVKFSEWLLSHKQEFLRMTWHHFSLFLSLAKVFAWSEFNHTWLTHWINWLLYFKA